MAADLIVFLIIALVAIASSILVLESEEIFHSALYLALMFVSVAGLFILLGAEFLAAIQVLIYAGAVIILVLFAIMLTKRGIALRERTTLYGKVTRLGVAAVFIFLLVVSIVRVTWPIKFSERQASSTIALGNALFTDYVIPFEIVSVVLLAALIGGIFLAKKEEVY
ncbi:MAG: NADH-quinone oxidoreductase subunit J [Candidatus Hydrothermarchaeales archaeon]